jgi:hypothetical protein
MAEQKTKPTGASVTAFIAGIPDPEKRKEIKKVGAMMRRATGARPKLWGTSIVGYGRYHYEYASGRSGDWMLTGYSPRKQALTVYIMTGFEPFAGLMDRLGTYKTGKSCLYIKRLADIDETVLESLIAQSVALMRERYETG